MSGYQLPFDKLSPPPPRQRDTSSLDQYKRAVLPHEELIYLQDPEYGRRALDELLAEHGKQMRTPRAKL